MEGVTTFLESSTIHGLTYISTTQKYARLFWILVVITGFVGAGLLIKESFDSWSESPVKTTIETLPIAELKLPKVTVCPPKNTFTDLNYDLMMTENITLTEETRDELFKYALEIINEDSFSENRWTNLHEDDRFYNWYHSYTMIDSPYYFDSRLNIDIRTVATSGVVTTQHYREQFMPKLVEKKIRYRVRVYPPESAKRNKNVTLHFKLEKLSMTELESGSEDGVYMHGLRELDPDLTTAYINFTSPKSFDYKVILSRDVSSGDVVSQKLDLMPGFRFSWWYSGMEVTPDNRYRHLDIAKQFVR